MPSSTILFRRYYYKLYLYPNMVSPLLVCTPAIALLVTPTYVRIATTRIHLLTSLATLRTMLSSQGMMSQQRTIAGQRTIPKEASNKRKRARDSLDAPVQPKGSMTGSAGASARFKNPFAKGAVSAGNAMSTEIAKPRDAVTAYLIPPGTIPPHPPQSYDSILPTHLQYSAYQQSAEPLEEPPRSPTPTITASGTETNPEASDACIDPAIVLDSDLLIASLAKAKPGQQPGASRQPNDAVPMRSTPASRFSLTTSKPNFAIPSNLTVPNLQAPPNGPKSIQSASNGRAAAIPRWLTDAITRLEAEARRLQEEVDNTRHTIKDQNVEMKALRDEIATLHEAQGQNTKDVGEIRTGLESLSSTVTEVVGRIDTINAAPLGDVKPIVAKPITTKKRRGKESATGENSGMTFINERDNTWNVSKVTRHPCRSTHLRLDRCSSMLPESHWGPCATRD